MPLPEEQDLTTALVNLTAALQAASPTWPLDKRETFTAFALMGLTSRLQPVATGKQVDKERLVALAKELGCMAAGDEPSKGK